MTKSEREVREYKSLFADERYAKKAWKDIMGASLSAAGSRLPTITDSKTKEPTLDSEIDNMAYNNVKNRLKAQGLDREPQQAELIVEAGVIRARFSDTTFNLLMDRTAGKVKDEITINKSAFEDLTDEELEILEKHRIEKEQNTDGSDIKE